MNIGFFVRKFKRELKGTDIQLNRYCSSFFLRQSITTLSETSISKRFRPFNVLTLI